MYTEEIGNVDGKYNMAHRLQVPYSSVIRSVVTFTKVRMLGWMLLGVLGC